MERNDILSVAIDTIKGNVDTKFSAKQNSEELRAALIDLNGGSTAINPKNFYRGTALFDLVEELIPVMIEEGINASTNPLFKLVDYRNLAAGDTGEFFIEGESCFVVANAAAGIQGVRRQRISNSGKVNVDPETKVVRVYENLGRLLAGKITFDKFVEGVAKAYEAYIAQAAYNALAGITASTYNLSSDYVKTGSYVESTLLTLCEHVEAATGKKPMILGTKTALRKLGSSITYSAEQNRDLYNEGYIGKFCGLDVLAVPQAHKPGTSTFALNDDQIFVVGSDDKPVKVVSAGDGILKEREATDNADLTQEYVYIQELGVGVACAAKLGTYKSMT